MNNSHLSPMSLADRMTSMTFQLREERKIPLLTFLIWSGYAAWTSFYNLHLDAIGYSSIQIGALNAIMISTSALVVPFWGMLADRLGNHRVLLLLSTVTALMVFFIGQTLVFSWMLIFICIISVFHQPSAAVLDGVTLGFVRQNEKYSYGQFRLFGSAAYALTSLVVGYFAKEDSSVIFPIAAGFFLLASVVNLITLPRKAITGRNLVNFKSFAVFFQNRKLLFFLILILLYGVGIAPLMQFINLYYLDIGADPSFIGWVFFAQAGIEVFLFLLAVRLVKKLGAEPVILIAMLVSVLRMVGYGFITRPEIAIFLSAPHGITIAFFLTGVVDYVQKRTPLHLRTTGQALVWAFHFGAGVTLGNLLLGHFRDHIGMVKAMHVHAAITLLLTILMLVFFRKISDRNSEGRL